MFLEQYISIFRVFSDFCDPEDILNSINILQCYSFTVFLSIKYSSGQHKNKYYLSKHKIGLNDIFVSIQYIYLLPLGNWSQGNVI